MAEALLSVCMYCSKVCHGNGYESRGVGNPWRGNIYFHQRCHAEAQDRYVYPQIAGGYVPYETPAEQLQWEKERELLLEKHKLEVDSYKRMLNDEKEDRKKLEESIIASLELRIEEKLEKKVDKLREEIFAGIACSSDTKQVTMDPFSEKSEVRTQLMSGVGEMMKNCQLEIIEKMDQMELQREEKLEKVRKEVVSSVSALIKGSEQKFE